MNFLKTVQFAEKCMDVWQTKIPGIDTVYLYCDRGAPVFALHIAKTAANDRCEIKRAAF